MKNTHLEHPEDSILTGDLSVLDWFSESDSIISTKMDGKAYVGTDLVAEAEILAVLGDRDNG